MPVLTIVQRFALILARTLIGWHFAYEGYFKLMLPGWTTAGQPLPAWSASGYLKGAVGPLAPMLRALADSSVMPFVDTLVPVGLLLVGLSLMAGFFTQTGCIGAMVFLALFYLSAIPTSGVQQFGAEGAYLFVNKNLVEFAAVLVIASFYTGRIAGLDLLWRAPRKLSRMAPSAT